MSIFEYPPPATSPHTMEGGATFSPDLRYRYTLRRSWGDDNPTSSGGAVNFICLNPSTANSVQDDPTVRRMIGFAKRWGKTRLVVTNLYALRSTDPKLLRYEPDPVGPENDIHLAREAALADTVVAAWGSFPPAANRARHVLELLAWCRIQCLGRTLTGHPRHPLYLAGATNLEDLQG